MSKAQTKVCKKCGKSKPLSEFRRNKASKDGRQSRCRQCQKERDTQYRAENKERLREGRARSYIKNREKNRERVRENGARYRAENRERVRRTRSKYYHERGGKIKRVAQRLLRIYNITLAEYDEMLEIQGGGCAICGRTPEENGKRLAVDHSHGAGRVRGLLCDDCNRGLGMFQDDPERLLAAILYIGDPLL